MGRWLGQSIVHALVAAALVELLVRAWREEEPERRLALRLFVLAAAVAAGPLFDALAPARREEWFDERWALLSSRHWAELTIGGVATKTLFLAALGLAGGILFLRDLIPFLRDRLARAPATRLLPADAALGPRIAALSSRLGIAPPALGLIESRAPVLLCRGVLRPRLCVSHAALALLDEQERDAALLHELAHAQARDPALGWLLMTVRAALAFNPVVQVMVRAISHDAERRADGRARAAGAEPAALASAILKLYRAGTQAAASPLARSLEWARARSIEDRCRRLLRPPPAPHPFPIARLLAGGGSLAGILFFVT